MQKTFIERLAEPNPVPGGGAAAAHAACVAVALLEKIVRVESGRESLSPESTASWNGLLARVRLLAEAFPLLREEDGAAYARLAQAKGSRAGADEAGAALAAATEPALGIMENASDGLDCVAEAAAGCKRHLLSDLSVVHEILAGAGRGVFSIGLANAGSMQNPAERGLYAERLKNALERLSRSYDDAGERIFARLSKAQ